MPGCAKCRFSEAGCAACNPGRFSLRNRCARQRGCETETLSSFRQWLVSAHERTPGVARDLAWGAQLWFRSSQAAGQASERQKEESKTAERYLEEFAKLPQFRSQQPAGLQKKARTPKKQSVARKTLGPEQRRQFAAWLVRKGFTEGSARDYAWSCSPGHMTPKRKQLLGTAKQWLEQWPQRQPATQSAAKSSSREPSLKEMRNKADELAKQILAEGRPVTEKDMRAVQLLWGYEKNNSRQPAKRGASAWAYFDIFGLTRGRTDGKWRVTPVSKQYKNVTKLVCNWLRDVGQRNFGQQFVFTSFSMNWNWETPFHRDGNEGPSIVRCFTKPDSGGQLRYWPGDVENLPPEEVQSEQHVDLDVASTAYLKDGNRGHSVLPFKGDRRSLVGFTRKGFSNKKVPKTVAKELSGLGFALPDEQTMQFFKSLLFKKPYMPLKKRRASMV